MYCISVSVNFASEYFSLSNIVLWTLPKIIVVFNHHVYEFVCFPILIVGTGPLHLPPVFAVIFFVFLSSKLIKVSYGLLLFISFGYISSSRIVGLVDTCSSVLSD